MEGGESGSSDLDELDSYWQREPRSLLLSDPSDEDEDVQCITPMEEIIRQQIERRARPVTSEIADKTSLTPPPQPTVPSRRPQRPRQHPSTASCTGSRSADYAQLNSKR